MGELDWRTLLGRSRVRFRTEEQLAKDTARAEQEWYRRQQAGREKPVERLRSGTANVNHERRARRAAARVARQQRGHQSR